MTSPTSRRSPQPLHDIPALLITTPTTNDLNDLTRPLQPQTTSPISPTSNEQPDLGQPRKPQVTSPTSRRAPRPQ
ncbi:unnamed protein product [Macrosiphum euphorbiae]|uniref:Uncharacterized protein n=1 Tax=Macrosiphum euphorbiae TaxID=13131 RepID=A0AAV0WWB9_9HEMI|nr:unnamed protein product [Macrosiphum euphorbiae]CAI6360123.1 unnamed protein product [Macrosiphum euphorbiae]